MDAIPKAPKKWKPELDMGGNAQISVRYRLENGRFAFDAVGLRRYLELFDQKLLKWQIEETERPEHNPTRVEAERLRKEEEAGLLAEDTSRFVPSIVVMGRRFAEEIEAEPEDVEDIEDSDLEEEEPPEEPDFDMEAAQKTLVERYHQAIALLAGKVGWSTLSYEPRVRLLAEQLGVETMVVASFLRQHAPLQKLMMLRKPEPAPAPEPRLGARVSAKEKLAALLRASKDLGGRNISLNEIVKRAAEVINEEGQRIKFDSLYAWVAAELSAEEKSALGVVLHRRPKRSGLSLRI